MTNWRTIFLGEIITKIYGDNIDSDEIGKNVYNEGNDDE